MMIPLEPLGGALEDFAELADFAGEEGEIYGDGGSARTAKSQLFNIAGKAQSLNDKLEEEDELPEWIQSKIAVMSDNMDAIADHLQYKIHRHKLDA
jgi:hypothetical protein